MRSNARFWFRIHSFTGVVTGLMLFVICWSGTFATLSREIDWLVTPEARVQEGPERASWGDVLTAVRAAYPGARVKWVSAPLYRRSAAEAVVDLPEQNSVRIYVDPYTGEVRGAYSYFNVQRFFRSFHYSLFYPNPWGLYLVCLLAVTMLASLIAALCFYRRWWIRFFRFNIGRGRKLWSELHKLAGLWSIWFLLVIGLTGVWYLLEAARYDVGDGMFAYAGDSEIAVHPVPEPASDRKLPPLPVESLLARAKHLRPDLDIRTIRFGGGGVLYLDGQADHFLVRDRANQLHLDARTGDVLFDLRASDLPLYWRWSDTADPLHFGDFGGLWSKSMWFAFGLILSGLILTGTWLHAHRLAREAGGRPRHRWPGTMAAITVSLGALGASVPFGFDEARELYGPTIDGMKHLPTLAPGVRAVIIGWIAATLAIVAAWILLLWRPRAVLRDVVRPVRNTRSAADRYASEGRAGK